MEEILRKNLHTDEQTLKQFLQYAELLQRTNEHTNLTAIRDEAEIARMHFLDCAAMLKYVDFTNKNVADIGTGGGFPGMPIKLLIPSAKLTLVDSNGKKISFLEDTCKKMGLDCRCILGRAEEMTDFRESFDIVVSRAVADLSILTELCLPLVKKGGLFVAMKGPDCDLEVERAKAGIKILGGNVHSIERYTVPDTDIVHAFVLIDKKAQTPAKYPRRYALIKKKPLGED